MRQSGGCLFQWEESMAEKEFDQLTPEEKKARFQKALDDYNSGFVEVDYALRSVASIRVEGHWKMPAEDRT